MIYVLDYAANKHLLDERIMTDRMSKHSGFHVDFIDAPKLCPEQASDIYNLYGNKEECKAHVINKKTYYYHKGLLSLISYNKATYLMAYFALGGYFKKNWGPGDSMWGVLTKIMPDRSGADVCYFDLIRNKSGK